MDGMIRSEGGKRRKFLDGIKVIEVDDEGNTRFIGGICKARDFRR